MSPKLSNAELLCRLVGFESVSCHSNVPIADFVCQYLDRPGIQIDRLANADSDKVNLVVRVGPSADESPERHGLTLSGHMDVVPADEPQWRSDPFTLTETDTAYFGRGACDMKGFVAQAANLIRGCDAGTLAHPLVLILTYDEEVGTIGAAHLAEEFPNPESLPRNAIVGEPTELRVVRMHKGHTKMRITLCGESAHSAYPHLGANAIEPAGRVIAALIDLRKKLESERTDTSAFFPDTPCPALNLALISGGTAINIIPDRCVIDFGIRLLPGMDALQMIARVRESLESIEGVEEQAFEVISDSPSLLAEEDSPLHRALCECVGQSEGLGVSYASDAGWLQRMGMDCVLFGAGSIEVAHRPNEFIPKDQFARAGIILEDMVRRFCME